MRDEARFMKGRAAASGRPVLALKPLRAAGNAFSGLFSDHIDGERFERVAFEWEHLGRARYDVVVFHWPTEFFRPESRRKTLGLLARMLSDKLRHRTKFVWVAHNLEPHDGSGRRSALTTALFLKLLDAVILLSDHSCQQLHRLYPSTRSLRALLTVHGRYESFVRPPMDCVPSGRRNKLLFFGLIRDYKNVERLIVEARKVRVDPFSLTVLGSCSDKGLENRIRAAAGQDSRISLDIRDAFVPDDELERAIDACDAVVLPYRNILNSGVALHSLGRNRPILAPNIGSLPELGQQVGGEWVHLFDGDISAEAIEAFLASLTASTATRPDLSAFDWSRIGADVTRFLQSL
jgi:beta-1,4-mannosyltransferase